MNTFNLIQEKDLVIPKQQNGKSNSKIPLMMLQHKYTKLIIMYQAKMTKYLKQRSIQKPMNWKSRLIWMERLV